MADTPYSLFIGFDSQFHLPQNVLDVLSKEPQFLARFAHMNANGELVIGGEVVDISKLGFVTPAQLQEAIAEAAKPLREQLDQLAAIVYGGGTTSELLPDPDYPGQFGIVIEDNAAFAADPEFPTEILILTDKATTIAPDPDYPDDFLIIGES